MSGTYNDTEYFTLMQIVCHVMAARNFWEGAYLRIIDNPGYGYDVEMFFAQHRVLYEIHKKSGTMGGISIRLFGRCLAEHIAGLGRPVAFREHYFRNAGSIIQEITSGRGEDTCPSGNIEETEKHNPQRTKISFVRKYETGISISLRDGAYYSPGMLNVEIEICDEIAHLETPFFNSKDLDQMRARNIPDEIMFLPYEHDIEVRSCSVIIDCKDPVYVEVFFFVVCDCWFPFFLYTEAKGRTRQNVIRATYGMARRDTGWFVEGLYDYKTGSVIDSFDEAPSEKEGTPMLDRKRGAE